MATSKRYDTFWHWVVAALWLVCGGTDVYAQNGRWERATTAGLQAFDQGDYDEAVRQFQTALATTEAFVPDDPRVSRSLMNLAIVYHTQGQYPQAEAFYQRTLGLQERLLGPEHPQLIEVLEAYTALQRQMYPMRSWLPWSPANKMAARATRIREREEQAILQEFPGGWRLDERLAFGGGGD